MGTTQENAETVRGLTARVGEAVAGVTQAIDILTDAVNTACSTLGSTAGADALNAKVQGVINVLSGAQVEVMSLNDAFEQAAASGG
ncbi:hypothetical protein [Amycolatopsis vancoresmycina]|uniref:Uncharacterized protein n=1 Tax=Amycolatopsis vancoresmycina DSM 44592 TaxID=1292037 RepID=R1I2Y5_9PSEU|nr:hypothetical protein [Amycolatopsis vancoresmycina]EOD66886.1 hypothetical protein H480_19223 [Amycolatopsis vancoresmycina DSM 44592]